jgi:hypothetical protein
MLSHPMHSAILQRHCRTPTSKHGCDMLLAWCTLTIALPRTCAPGDRHSLSCSITCIITIDYKQCNLEVR